MIIVKVYRGWVEEEGKVFFFRGVFCNVFNRIKRILVVKDGV